jgi:hypothetical protein
MANNSSGRYFVKNTSDGVFTDITTLFDGVAVLKVDGMLAKGKPVNIFTQQWIDTQYEDFMITTEVTTTTNGVQTSTPVVIRENVDIELTFIVRKKYASANAQSNFNVLTAHDTFVDYMTKSDVWLKSSYVGNKYVHCVCIKEYKPTTVKLERGNDSYIIGTITFHTLDAPTS